MSPADVKGFVGHGPQWGGLEWTKHGKFSVDNFATKLVLFDIRNFFDFEE